MATGTRSKSKDYYALLEVERSADAAIIGASYRRLARLKHPDKNRDNPEATAEFQSLQEAYSVLKDKTTRYAYDLQCLAATRTEALRRKQQQQQQQQRKTKPGLYVYHISSDWNQSSMNTDAEPSSYMKMPSGRKAAGLHESTSYPPSPPQKPMWPEKPPSPKPELEQQIEEVRNEIAGDDKIIAGLTKKNKELQSMITVLWKVIDDVNGLIAQASGKIAELKQSTDSQDWFAGLFMPSTSTSTSTPWPPRYPSGASAEQPTQQGHATPPATAERLETLTKAHDKLQNKLERIKADLEETMTQSRSIATEIQEMEEKKAAKRPRLHELCHRWKVHFFGDRASEADSNDDDERYAWSGHNTRDKGRGEDTVWEEDDDETGQWWDPYEAPYDDIQVSVDADIDPMSEDCEHGGVPLTEDNRYYGSTGYEEEQQQPSASVDANLSNDQTWSSQETEQPGVHGYYEHEHGQQYDVDEGFRQYDGYGEDYEVYDGLDEPSGYAEDEYYDAEYGEYEYE